MWAHSRPISSSSMCAGMGERNETPSMAMTASTSASLIGSTSNACGSLLTAMAVGFPGPPTLSAPGSLRKFGRLGASDRVEDRRPQAVDPLARLARNEQRPRGAAAAAERGPGAFAKQAPGGRGQLVDLGEHDLGRHVLGAQPLVELPLLILDSAPRVDEHDEQGQRAPGARVALDQRLPGAPFGLRHLRVAVAR